MTFDQYMKRPVYVAQCRTWKRAAELNLCSLGIRAVKEYRDGYAQAARGMIALSIRMDRARGRLMKPNGEVRGASRLAGEASSAEGATSTVVLGATRPGKERTWLD